MTRAAPYIAASVDFKCPNGDSSKATFRLVATTDGHVWRTIPKTADRFPGPVEAALATFARVNGLTLAADGRSAVRS